jgi:predicted NUDIX family NTP pyrophosphohydrolase
MPAVSAGLLLYRHDPLLQVFLVHPGGPYWATKDLGAWSIPKGLAEPGEDELVCARREFREETGGDPQGAGPEQQLGLFRLPGGKRLHVWALRADFDAGTLRSNTFAMEFPPHSGQIREFPEVDRGGWFDRSAALQKITRGQLPVLERFFSQQDREANS